MVSGSMIVWWLHCPTPSLNWWHTAGIVCQNTSHSWNSSGLNILGLSCVKVFYCFLITGSSLSDWVIPWLSQNMTTDFSGIYLNRTCLCSRFLFLVQNQSDMEQLHRWWINWIHSLCFISNTVKKRLVTHFPKFHSGCLALLSCCLFS